MSLEMNNDLGSWIIGVMALVWFIGFFTFLWYLEKRSGDK